jgi:hypothetical protein
MREEAEMSKGKKTTRTPRRKGTGRANSGTGNDKALREHLAKVLTWGEAHADWKQALEGLDPSQRGIRPAGSPYSAWELLEHARISQEDILDFSTNPHYVQRDWPAEYWPKTVAPPDNATWEKSVKEFAKDTQAMMKLIEDPRTDLFVAARRPQCLSLGTIRAGAAAVGNMGQELANASREFARQPL